MTFQDEHQWFSEAGADIYQSARAAYASGAWVEALRLAGGVLARDPLHTGAAELVAAARRALDAADRAGGERRMLTVVFCDLVGSTALVADLGPERYRELMLEVHDLCVRAITEFEGRVAQFLGDGILAYFCFPQAHEDDARRAVEAALAITAGIRAQRADFAARFGRDIAYRIGIDTGTLVIGALGSGQWRTSDSIVGDAANIAARLQSEAAPNEILITDATYQLVKDSITVGPSNLLHLRNYAWPVRAHAVIGGRDVPRRADAPSRVRAPLVGRAREVEAVSEAWAAVLAGEPRRLLVVGAAGMGKSRLVEHAANLVHAGGGSHIELRCSSRHAHTAFRPAAAAVRELLDLGELDTASGTAKLAQRLATLAPGGGVTDETVTGLACLLGLPIPVQLLPEQIRIRAVRAFCDLVAFMARSAPLLVVVEDAHDADASTLDLLAALDEVPAPLLLVVTSRGDRPGPAPTTPVLRLRPLSRGDTEALVRSLIGDDGADTTARVADRSAGVPLFAEELALAVNEGSTSGHELPATLAPMFTGRLDQLDGTAREVAEAASVLGHEFPAELLSEVLAIPATTLQPALGRLVRRRVLRAADTAIRFRHPLVRDAAYDRLLEANRRRLHRRAARVLQQRHRAGLLVDAEVVAGHLAAAGERPDAFDWWQRAGAAAAGIGANVESVAHYGRALALIGVLEEGAHRDAVEFDLQLRLGFGASTAEGYTSERALLAYERADELGAVVATTPDLVPAIWGMWSFHTVRGNHVAGRRLAAQATRAAATSDDAQATALAAAITGYQEFYLGELAAAETALLVARTGDGHPDLPHDPAIASRSLLAVARYIRGDTAGGLRENAAAKAAAATLTDRRAALTRAYTSAYSAWLHQIAEDPVAARADAAATVALAHENNFPTWMGAGSLHLAIANCALGDHEQWLPQLGTGIDLWRKVGGAELLVPYFLGRLGAALTDAGRLDEALAAFAEALSVVDVSAESFYQPELYRLQAAALHRAGAGAAEVRAALDLAAHHAEMQGSRLFHQRALLDAGQLAPAGGPDQPTLLTP